MFGVLPRPAMLRWGVHDGDAEDTVLTGNPHASSGRAGSLDVCRDSRNTEGMWQRHVPGMLHVESLSLPSDWGVSARCL